MYLAFEGWAKNHGLKTMLSQTLKGDQIVGDPFPMSRMELKATVLTPEEDMADGIRIYFSTDMKLGGSQMGRLQISTKELMRMLKACTANRSLEAFISLYNDA